MGLASEDIGIMTLRRRVNARVGGGDPQPDGFAGDGERRHPVGVDAAVRVERPGSGRDQARPAVLIVRYPLL